VGSTGRVQLVGGRANISPTSTRVDATMFAPRVAKPQTKAAEGLTSKLTPQHSVFPTRPFGSGAVEQAHFLQSTTGNQATLRFLSQRGLGPARGKNSGDHEQDGTPKNTTIRAATPGVSWDFRKIPVFPPDQTGRPLPSCPLSTTPLLGVIQAKLVVGPVDDPLEHEADRVADQMVRMPVPGVSTAAGPTQLSRKCTACEEERRSLQTNRTGPQTTADAARDSERPEESYNDVEARVRALRTGGTALPANLSSYFSSKLGFDFSQVRIHDDALAAEAARQLRANAFAVGNHIAFASGSYNHDTPAGQWLIAHELAHVVQQGAAPGTAAGSSALNLQRQVANEARDAQGDGAVNISQIVPAALPDETLITIAEAALEANGYDWILQMATSAGFLRTKEATPVQAHTDAANIPVFRQAQAGAVAWQVFTRYALAAGVTSQLDSPAPGPADLVALGILVVGTAVALYTLASYSQCDAALATCLGNPWQPDWNRGDFGPRKDCGACYRECKHAGGIWPDYKCPR
jgi:hypothetical protein